MPNIKANTPEAARLFVQLSQTRPGFAKRFLADPEGNLGTLKQLVSEVAPQFQLRNGSKGKGKGKGKGTLPRHAPANSMAFARRDAKSAGKGSVPFAEQQLPECFCLHNGEPVPLSDPLSVE